MSAVGCILHYTYNGSRSSVVFLGTETETMDDVVDKAAKKVQSLQSNGYTSFKLTTFSVTGEYETALTLRLKPIGNSAPVKALDSLIPVSASVEI